MLTIEDSLKEVSNRNELTITEKRLLSKLNGIINNHLSSVIANNYYNKQNKYLGSSHILVGRT
ncbi:MAG: hypothetical protein LBM96_03670 [Methanobrevibacter sp.]|nr:hypothetical protein [Candidatus Methanoflexus mossambicus]